MEPRCSSAETQVCHRSYIIAASSPRKVSRFAPLNRYYIIIDEVFFDNFLVIIYLLVVCKKIIIHSFWSTLIIYLLVVTCIQKKKNSFILVKDLKRNFSCKINKKPHKNSKKVVFFCTNPKVHEMTKMLYKCANNHKFNQMSNKE
jgi:hypothetical protein